jgi:hypothetical protein
MFICDVTVGTRRSLVPEKRIKTQVPLLGLVDAFVVGVSESTERWTEIKLDDGTALRLKPVVLEALRIDGQYDPDGNPMYALKANQVMIVVNAPDHLRKGGSGSKGVH